MDGAEAEAVFENSLTLLEGSASIYDEVVCKYLLTFAMTLLFHILTHMLLHFYFLFTGRCSDGYDQLNNEPPIPVRGYGCDSIDNNCDGTVDECEEDKFSPIINTAAAVQHCGSGNGEALWFTSEQDALDCVAKYASVEDDCDSRVSLGAAILAGNCTNAQISFEETEDRCRNPAVIPSIDVFVDAEPPIVKCWFGTDENDPLFQIADTGAGIMTHVDLQVSVEDTCATSSDDIEVEYSVSSNEIEGMCIIIICPL